MVTRGHIVNKQTGYMGNFFRKRSFLEKKLGKPIPMTLCGLTKDTMEKNEGLTFTKDCNCELCLQVNDNVERPDI